MGIYRGKPVEVEAFQMTRERRWHNVNWPMWLHKAWSKEAGDAGSLYKDNGSDRGYPFLCIGTSWGERPVCEGDYIVKGVDGEIYPCSSSIFEATYAVVDGEHYLPPKSPDEVTMTVMFAHISYLYWEMVFRIDEADYVCYGLPSKRPVYARNLRNKET